TASSLNIVFLPVATACFLVLLLRASFMGDARPTGLVRIGWTVMLCTSIVVMSTAAFFGLRANYERFRAEWGTQPGPVEEVIEEEARDAAPAVDAAALPMGTFEHRAMATEFVITMYGPRAESTGYEQRQF